jgi:hypothetical protein
MSAAILYMSMSLDGFIAGPNEGPSNALGDGGHRLHEWRWRMSPAAHQEFQVVRRRASTAKSSTR